MTDFSDWNVIRVNAAGNTTGVQHETLDDTIATSGHAHSLTAGTNFTVDGVHYTYEQNVSVGGTTGFLASSGGHTYYFTQDTPPTHTSVVDETGTGGDHLLLCFMAGTRIATPDGETAVETLAPGDLVLTADGTAAPVRWIGRQTVSTRFADPERSLPVRITAGALGENLPRRDLLLSPGHAVFVDGMLINAAALVNGSSIVRERNVPEVFTYYHVELADHMLVLAEGARAETFVDNAARENFDNYAERDRLTEAAPIAEMDLPRAYAARQIPAATRRLLAEVAERLAGPAAAAA